MGQKHHTLGRKSKSQIPFDMSTDFNQLLVYLKYGPNPASFRLFSSFSQCNKKYSTKFDYLKAWTVGLGFESRTTVW